jgi:hypothetical protein
VKRASLVVASIVTLAVNAAAQSRRAPTPAETTVLARFIDVMTPILERFVDASWQVKENGFPDNPARFSISMKPGVPLDDCFGGERTWGVPEGSPRFNARLKPLYERAQSLTDGLLAKYKAGQDATADAKELERLHQQIKDASELTVEVCANSPVVDAAALHSNQPSLVPGIPARKVDGGCGVDVANCYVLAFGDWSTARLNAPDKLYDFHFVHPAASPYIENIVIKLHGADDRIQEMLKAVDWTRVNGALTK